MSLDNEHIGKVAAEASKILKDYPHLKYCEVIQMAKEVLKEKGPEGGKRNWMNIKNS